jgi:hypothetical protein
LARSSARTDQNDGSPNLSGRTARLICYSRSAVSKLRTVTLLVIIGLLPAACKIAGSGPLAAATPALATASPFIASAIPALNSPTFSPTPPPVDPTVTATSPTATAQATATDTPKPQPPSLSESLLQIVESDDWQTLGMDPDQAARWERFARSGDRLSSEEENQYVQNFVQQWELVNVAAEHMVVPDDVRPALRVMILEHEIGGAEPVLYAAVANGFAPEGEQQLYLIALDAEGEPVGLLAAPVITGLRQQISVDGRYVEYVDAARNVHLLSADARQLTGEGHREETLLEMLGEVYTNLSSYTRSKLYPRYTFPIQGVESSFYTVETLLTHLQIVQMNEAFQLLSRPEFAPLKDAIFTQDTTVTIIEHADLYAGLTVLGSGVMQLDRRDLLGDKYILASVLIHEGAHILQPVPKGSAASSANACNLALRMEIGDRKIPEGFFDWTAEQILEGIDSQEIGAYHAGFWVLEQIGVLGEGYYWPDWREILSTGMINQRWIAGVCER